MAYRATIAQALRCRCRHQPRRPPLAKIRPGSPAPAVGPAKVCFRPGGGGAQSAVREFTRTVLDVSRSERALCLTRLGTLRILARGDRKAARLDRCITQWLEIGVFFTRLPLLHIVERFPSGDHDAP